MPLEIMSVTLLFVGMAGVVVMLLVGLAGLMDPTTFRRCQDCSRWMIDTVHRPDGLCFRCRHAHHHHDARLPVAHI